MGTTSARSKISGLIHGSKLMTIVIPLKLMFLMYQQTGMLFCTREPEPLFDIYYVTCKILWKIYLNTLTNFDLIHSLNFLKI